MNFPVRLATVFSVLIAGVCGGASAQEATAHDILDQSLRAQHAFRSLSGTYRTMFTNFAPDDDTPAAAHAGRFILMRSRPNGPIDRLNFRDANLLKETPGDSVTCCTDGTGVYYISPDGTGERLETTAIESMWIVSILDKMETRTRQMLDSAATAQLPDTTIDGRQCYFFSLHTLHSAPGDTLEGWYKLAIDRHTLLPVWHGRRDRSTGRFCMDQSSFEELAGLRIDPPVTPETFIVPTYRNPRPTVPGSCNPGETAPLWKDLPDAATGRLYSLDSLLKAGNTVVMDWSTSTCGACLMAMPTVDSLYRHYRNRGAAVVFVMMDHGDSRKQTRSLIERKGIEYPVLLCPTPVADAYGLYAYPVFLVVGSDGRVAFRYNGFGGDSESLWNRLAEAIDATFATLGNQSN